MSPVEDGFLDLAARELRLNRDEIDLFTRGGIGSFDELAELLLANPSLAREQGRWGVRVDALLARLDGLLSAEYRESRDAALPDAPAAAPGAAVPEDAAPTPGQPIRPPPPWPGRDRNGRLDADPEIPVSRQLLALWPVPDQDGTPSCVGFAVAAMLEVAAMQRVRPAPRLSAMFLYQRALARRRAKLAPAEFAAEGGATKLADAGAVLAEEGICAEPLWPNTAPLAQEPDQAARDAAAQNRVGGCAHWDMPPGAPRLPNVARGVLDLLAERGAVVIALPVFRDPAQPVPPPNHWWGRQAQGHGHVPDPLAPPAIAAGGHAVCVVGFQPDPAQGAGRPTGGGWFIFRNSVGIDWGLRAPNRLARRLPQVPGRGWGAISASHVEDFCWEILAPPKP